MGCILYIESEQELRAAQRVLTHALQHVLPHALHAQHPAGLTKRSGQRERSAKIKLKIKKTCFEN